VNEEGRDRDKERERTCDAEGTAASKQTDHSLSLLLDLIFRFIGLWKIND
jgi:hypothetical protein